MRIAGCRASGPRIASVKKPMVSPLGAASPSWLLPISPPAPPTFFTTMVGLPGMCAGRCCATMRPSMSVGPPAG